MQQRISKKKALDYLQPKIQTYVGVEHSKHNTCGDFGKTANGCDNNPGR